MCSSRPRRTKSLRREARIAVGPASPRLRPGIPERVRTIVGVSTSVTLFIGRTRAGPLNDPMRLTNYTDFVRAFGEDNTISDVARYVKLFFLNSGHGLLRDGHRRWCAAGGCRARERGRLAVLGSPPEPGALGDSMRARPSGTTAVPEATFDIELFRRVIDSAATRSRPIARTGVQPVHGYGVADLRVDVPHAEVGAGIRAPAPAFRPRSTASRGRDVRFRTATTAQRQGGLAGAGGTEPTPAQLPDQRRRQPLRSRWCSRTPRPGAASRPGRPQLWRQHPRHTLLRPQQAIKTNITAR